MIVKTNFISWRTIATTRLSGQSDLDPVFDLSRHLGNRDVHQTSRTYAGQIWPFVYQASSDRATLL